jgi:signal peptidase I
MMKSNLSKIAILSLVGALVFSWTWVAVTHLRGPEIIGRNLEDRTEYFHGYKAFMSKEINFTTAGLWGMERTISENDVVMWVRVNPQELRVGDIIIYREPPENALVAHRIVGVEEGSFQTRGDSLGENDPYLVDDELEGIVIGVLYHSARR